MVVKYIETHYVLRLVSTIVNPTHNVQSLVCGVDFLTSVMSNNVTRRL